MKNSLYMTVIILAFLTISAFAQAVEVVDHWSPYKYPTSFPENARIHIIVKGDTLWDIAGQYYSNPLVWPHVHSANPYIEDPHWIYPGDPVVLPDLEIAEGGIIKRPGEQPGGERQPLEGEQEEATAEEQQREGGPREEGIPEDYMRGVIFDTEPRASRNFEAVTGEIDLYCSHVVYPENPNPQIYITGTEELEQIEIQVDDILYLNLGSEDVSPGERFVAGKFYGKVSNPESGKFIGYAYQELGIVRVLLATDNFSVATVEQACDGLAVGAKLFPYKKRAAPIARIRKTLPVEERYTEFDQEATGNIIYTNYSQHESGASDVVSIDIGSNDGLIIGSRVIFFKQSPMFKMYEIEGQQLPQQVAHVDGEGIVFRLTETTATVKLTYTLKSLELGDLVLPVEPYQP